MFTHCAGLCQGADVSAPGSCERLKQLVLDTLLHMVGSCSVEQAGSDIVNVDIVVDCLRNTTNPQTHDSALSLLAAVARTAPSRVLSAVLPVFTFVGSQLVRHDDSFSFNLITRTVTAIVPAILSFSEGPALAHHVLSVFAEAWPNIPAHRRIALYATLLQALGPAQYLAAATALLLHTAVVDARHAEPSKSDYPSEAVGEFCLELAREFPVATQTMALLDLLRLLARSPAEPLPPKQKVTLGKLCMRPPLGC